MQFVSSENAKKYQQSLYEKQANEEGEKVLLRA
jgi:hypothetical protein